MRFMILMYADPQKTKALSAAQLETIRIKHEALRAQLAKTHELIKGAGLAYTEGIVTLVLQDGKPTRIDGPIYKPLEKLTAYYVVECVDQTRAVVIGEQMLGFHVTRVEVRAVHDSADMPNANNQSV